jgi:predicted GNAT superfamily acetyltransferase
MLSRDKQLAIEWRLATRELFQSYFERGYLVKGFHRSDAGAFYRLEREEVPAD